MAGGVNLLLRSVGLAVILAMFSPLAAKDLEDLHGSLVSPNGKLEVYWAREGQSRDVNGQAEDYGTKLFLRAFGATTPGILLRKNPRWMGASWSPESRWLAIEDHWDGHASQVFVYEAVPSRTGRIVESRLVFSSPDNHYDLHWYFESWGPGTRQIRLRREQRLNDGLETPPAWRRHAAVEHVTFAVPR